jgi:hypothetical protein
MIGRLDEFGSQRVTGPFDRFVHVVEALRHRSMFPPQPPVCSATTRLRLAAAVSPGGQSLTNQMTLDGAFDVARQHL